MLLWSALVVGLLGTGSLALSADESEALGAVLGDIKNLTTFNDLFRKNPDILLELPGLDGVTIIAPSNQAFKNIPYTPLNGVWDADDKDVVIPLLQYHILAGTINTANLEVGPSVLGQTLLTRPTYANVTGGQNIIINKQPGDVVVITSSLGTRSTLVKRDIPFRGGVIHIVDNFLIPPAPLVETTESFKLPSFLGALYTADLMPDAAERKDVTIFAPQDSALEAVGGTLEGLDAEAIARIMGYHIIPDRVLVSSNFTNGTRLPTLAGDDGEAVLIRQAGNNKYVNSAQILQPDILIANGILHIISNVLNPDADSVAPAPENPTQAPVFPVSTVSDPFTSAIPCSTDCPETSATTEAPETTSDSDANNDEQTSTEIETSPSDDAAGARYTAPVAGAALGLLGFGAGLVLL